MAGKAHVDKSSAEGRPQAVLVRDDRERQPAKQPVLTGFQGLMHAPSLDLIQTSCTYDDEDDLHG